MFDLDRFKDLCKQQGIKQAALFEMVGRPRTYSSDLKKVKNVPTEYIETWAAALRTTPAYLMGETDDPSEGTKKEPATGEGDGLEKQLIAFYGEVKSYLDEDDLNDIKIFMQMKADYKKRKMMENHDKG